MASAKTRKSFVAAGPRRIAIAAPNSAAEEHAAEIARSARDASGTGDDPLGMVAQSGHGTDADAGEYLNP